MKLKILLLSFLAVFLMTGSGFAYTIDDDYIGAAPNSNAYWGADRIGDANHFEIYGMDVSFSDVWTIDIYSSFFDGSVGTLGTQLGDLFISTDGWSPNTATTGTHGTLPETSYDSASNGGEDWEIAVVLDDHSGGTTSGSADIYFVNQDNIDLSDTVFNQYTYRTDQEVWYLPDNETPLGAATWSYGDEMLTITISDPDVILAYWDMYSEIGFHYGMTCANDVIEGSAPVPEPSTMLLFGTGFLGLAMIGRKKLFKK